MKLRRRRFLRLTAGGWECELYRDPQIIIEWE